MRNVEQIQKYLSDHNLCVEVEATDGRIAVNIEWGDWKHDHAYCDYLMEIICYKCIDTEITEQDGSDTYSAIHTYEPLKKK